MHAVRIDLLFTFMTVILLSVQCNGVFSPQRKPLIKAPEGSPTTGHHIVVLNDDSSRDDLHNVMEKVKRMSEDVTVHRYTEHVGKTLTVNAPDHIVDKIRHLEEVSHVEEDDYVFGEAVLDKTNKSISESVKDTQKHPWFLDRLNQIYLPLDKILPRPDRMEGSVDVYVMDTGILYEHPEFENRAKYPDYDPIDESQFGTDDYEKMFGRDCNGHGTLVASLIGGKTYGTAKKANLLSVRVLNCQLAGSTSLILDGLEFITAEVTQRRRPAIVSMALRGTIHKSLTDAITNLYNKDVLIVGSVGNTHEDACDFFPANSPLVLRVGASTEDDCVYEKSNYGSCVDVFAPGANIYGPDINCPTCQTNHRYFHNGTSLATAITCGIAAVQLSHSPLIKPSALKDQIILLSTKDILKFNLSDTPNRLVNIDGGSFYVTTSDEKKLIRSPQFPNNYPNSVKAFWTIYTPKDALAMVEFVFIKTETNHDKIRVCSGTSCENKNYLLAELTGDYGEISCGYVSVSEALTIELFADDNNPSTGFKAYGSAVKESNIQECTRPDKSTALQLDVISQGTNVGNRFSMSMDWQQVFSGRRRGMNIAVIDEVTGELLSTDNYDTWISTVYSINFARKIEGLHPGALVMVASSGYASRYLEGRAYRALQKIGSRYHSSHSATSSWAMVGVKGLREENAVENFYNTLAVNTSSQFRLQAHKQHGIRITVLSSGTYSTAGISITVDSKEIDTKGEDGSDTGLNVVVVDEVTGAVLHARAFNTHAEIVSDYSPSDAFVDFIKALPTGRVVAIGIKGDAITHLTDEAKDACKSIGSQLIDYAQIERSWAIVGRKGTSNPGEVSETVKFNSKARANYYLRVGDMMDSSYCNISASSSTYWTPCDYTGRIGSFIAIGNSTYPSNLCPSSYGITVGYVKEDSCEFEETAQYNTNAYGPYSSNSFRAFIDKVKNGRIVVLSFTADAYRYLYDSGREAFELIGSVHRYNFATNNAFAIIGRKGAPPGSVPEAYQDVDTPYTASVSASIPLKAPDLPELNECKDSIYQVNCRAGQKLSI